MRTSLHFWNSFDDLVRVRTFLSGGIGTGPVADALEIVGHCANRTVTENLKHLKIAAGVAGCKKIPPRWLHAEMRGILAIRRDQRVERSQHPVRLVYDIGAHTPFRHLVNGIQVPHRRIEGEAILGTNKLYEFHDWKLACGGTQLYNMTNEGAAREFSILL
jgi:hypothetical protein